MSGYRLHIENGRLLNLAAEGRKLPHKLGMELIRTVRVAMLHVQRRAMIRTPRDTGVLVRSATSDVRFGQGGLHAEVQFGGLASAYAEVQHEREDFQHPRGGQAHFLVGSEDSAWNKAEQRLVTELITRKAQQLMDKHLGRGAL